MVCLRVKFIFGNKIYSYSNQEPDEGSTLILMKVNRYQSYWDI